MKASYSASDILYDVVKRAQLKQTIFVPQQSPNMAEPLSAMF